MPTNGRARSGAMLRRLAVGLERLGVVGSQGGDVAAPQRILVALVEGVAHVVSASPSSSTSRAFWVWSRFSD